MDTTVYDLKTQVEVTKTKVEGIERYLERINDVLEESKKISSDLTVLVTRHDERLDQLSKENIDIYKRWETFVERLDDMEDEVFRRISGIAGNFESVAKDTESRLTKFNDRLKRTERYMYSAGGVLLGLIFATKDIIVNWVGSHLH